MSQENCTQSKSYKHSRQIAIEILQTVQDAIGEEKGGVGYFDGYNRGIDFAIRLLEEEWTSLSE